MMLISSFITKVAWCLCDGMWVQETCRKTTMTTTTTQCRFFKIWVVGLKQWREILTMFLGDLWVRKHQMSFLRFWHLIAGQRSTKTDVVLVPEKSFLEIIHGFHLQVVQNFQNENFLSLRSSSFCGKELSEVSKLHDPHGFLQVLAQRNRGVT